MRSSTSQKTGRAPAFTIASAVASFAGGHPEDDLTLAGFTEPGKPGFYSSEKTYDFGPRMVFPSLESFFDANSNGFEVSDGELTALLGDEDEHIRGWAIQLLAERAQRQAVRREHALHRTRVTQGKVQFEDAHYRFPKTAEKLLIEYRPTVIKPMRQRATSSNQR